MPPIRVAPRGESGFRAGFAADPRPHTSWCEGEGCDLGHALSLALGRKPVWVYARWAAH